MTLSTELKFKEVLVDLGFPIAIPLRIALRYATQFLLPFPQDLLRIFRFLLRLICD